MVIIIYYGKHLKSFSCCWVTSCSNEDLVLKRASGQIVSSRYGSCFWLHCYALTCGAKGERTNTTFQNLNTLTNLIWTVFCGTRTVSFQFTYLHVPLFLKYILIFFSCPQKGIYNPDIWPDVKFYNILCKRICCNFARTKDTSGFALK